MRLCRNDSGSTVVGTARNPPSWPSWLRRFLPPIGEPRTPQVCQSPWGVLLLGSSAADRRHVTCGCEGTLSDLRSRRRFGNSGTNRSGLAAHLIADPGAVPWCSRATGRPSSTSMMFQACRFGWCRMSLAAALGYRRGDRVAGGSQNSSLIASTCAGPGISDIQVPVISKCRMFSAACATVTA